MICPSCSGSGVEPDMYDCAICKGTGEVPDELPPDADAFYCAGCGKKLAVSAYKEFLVDLRRLGHMTGPLYCLGCTGKIP